MKTPGQILQEIAVKVYKSPYPWSEVSLDRRKKYEKAARLFLAEMNKSNPAAKPSNKHAETA